MEHIKIAIAEKHDILRPALAEHLGKVDYLDVVFDSSGGMDLMDKLSTRKVDVLLLSTSLVGYRGEDALKVIYESGEVPNLKIIMFSNEKYSEYFKDLIKLGLNSSLIKTADLDEIIESIETVHKEGYYFNKYFTKEILDSVLTETI